MPTGKPGSNPPQLFVCEYCDREFCRVVTRSTASTFRFCSPACRNKARQLASIPCPICGNLFKSYKWVSEKAGKKVFCSRACADKALIGRQSTNPDVFPQEIRDKVIELYPTTSAKVIATQLGIKTSQVHGMAARFGLKHTPDSYRKIVHGAARAHMLANNPSRLKPYRIKHKDDRGPNWNSQRKKALLRDGRQCQVCGKNVNRIPYDYNVHHIRPFREFGADYVSANHLSNLITLCCHCHRKVESGQLACPIPLPTSD